MRAAKKFQLSFHRVALQTSRGIGVAALSLSLSLSISSTVPAVSFFISFLLLSFKGPQGIAGIEPARLRRLRNHPFCHMLSRLSYMPSQ